MTPDHEQWAVALSVEKPMAAMVRHTSGNSSRVAEDGNFEGVAMWRKVTERFGALKLPGTPN